jgi:methanogenic corrinoid protein MtbC1
MATGTEPLAPQSKSGAGETLEQPWGWTDLLSHAVTGEIIPRLLANAPAGAAPAPHDLAIAAFVELVMKDDHESVRALVERAMVQSGGRQALLNNLLLPAARHFGAMWERDECDFMDVTLGVYRLDQIMKETATESDVAFGAYENRILMLPAPGEQHRFGCDMVADAFRAGGWCVRTGPAMSRAELLAVVGEEWFDVIGLSVTSTRWLSDLPGCVRELRHASTNPAPFVMLGGYAIGAHAERTRFLGADATAASAEDALLQANSFVAAARSARLPAYAAKRADAG